jgi:hypothetical protein
MYNAHTDLRGLLPLVLIAVGAETRTLLTALPPIRYNEDENSNIGWAALVIELAQGALTSARTDELVRVAARMIAEKERRLYNLVEVLEHHERFNETIEKFFIELWLCLKEADWGGKAGVIYALSRSLPRRSSGVAEGEVWKSLQLPGRLLPLVGGP